MGDKSHIEWTDATWNPMVGCTRVSPGCDHCYAIRAARRFDGNLGVTRNDDSGLDWTGEVYRFPDRLERPLRWRRPRRIFVNSLSDLFHDQVPDEYIAEVFAVMALAQQHTFQVLTKRHGRMRSLLSSADFQASVFRAANRRPIWARPEDPVSWPLPNVWLGVSAENQQWADIRIQALLETPAAVRWVSAEPLLGPIDLTTIPASGFGSRSALTAPCAACGGWGKGPIGVARDCPEDYHFVNRDAVHPTLDWVVVGGESGPGARPMAPQWARDIRDQCARAGVPFLFKQWGAWAPTGARGIGRPLDGRRTYALPADDYGLYEELARVSKAAAGRHLDGQLHDDYPGVGG